MPLTSQPLDLPFSEACERNKQPLLEALRAWLPQPPDRPVHVLEVGSGTGQHGAHFSEHLPVRWQLSDRPEHLPGLRRRQVQVAVVGDHVELSIGEELIRRHPIRHDRTREHGALANPGGRPRRINAA